MDHFDVCVVGAGVVGLAIARQLSANRSYPPGSVLLLEQNALPGQEISSRNSEVIHAGLYYPPGSLKAQLCFEGNSLIYRFCNLFSVPHKRLGKFVVATESELSQLESLHRNAQSNSITNLLYLDRKEIKGIEPHLLADHALYSPDTGIVDSHAFMQKLLQHCEAADAIFATHSFVESVARTSAGFLVTCRCGEAGNQEEYKFVCEKLINSAGLQAQALAALIEGVAPDHIPPLFLCKGSYFSLRGKSPVRHLVYPMPEENHTGLGIHATLDIGGQLKFGPDVEYTYTLNYRVDTKKRTMFANAIQRYLPSVTAADLQADFAGYRPKLQAPGKNEFKDFVIQGEAVHGIPGLVQLFGIESPGLTAALAIAITVDKMLD